MSDDCSTVEDGNNQQYQFRGNFVKAEIFYLVECKVITIKEAWCLLIIDNLCHVYKRDAFISNEALAEKLQVKKIQTSRILSKLKKLGLIWQTAFDGRKRYMRVLWENARDILANTEAEQQVRVIGNDNPELSKTTTIIREKNKNLNIIVAGKPGDSQKVVKNDFFTKCARHLAKTIEQVRKINKRTDQTKWANDFKALFKDLIGTDKEKRARIKTVLEWYRTYFAKHRCAAHTFNIQTGRKFRDNFGNMEGRMLADSGPIFEIKLSKQEQKRHDTMLNNLASNDLIDTDTLPSLVRELSEYMERADAAITKHVKHRSSRKLYRDSLFSARDLFSGYATWIAYETQSWTNWSGDLASLSTSGKNFDRYIRSLVRSGNFSLKGELTKVLEDARTA